MEISVLRLKRHLHMPAPFDEDVPKDLVVLQESEGDLGLLGEKKASEAFAWW